MNKTSKSDYLPMSELINHIRTFLDHMTKKLWWLLLVITVGAGLGGLIYTMQKPKYEAVCTFILEEKTSGSNGLTGLASQFGFDIGSLGGGGSIFAGDNILDILASKKIVYEVLLSKVTENSGETLADLFLNFSGWKKKWGSDSQLKNINFINCNSAQLLSLKQDSVLSAIHQTILKKQFSAERLDKKGSIIKVQIVSPNSLFARLMTERLVDAAAKLYLNIKTGTAQANIDRLQRRSDSLVALLNQKSFSAAASQPLDINPGMRTAAVPLEIANRDKTVIATLYAEVTKNLEASKMLLSQETPVIQMLDSPGALLDDHKKSLAFFLIIGGLVSAIGYVLIVFALFVVKRIIKLDRIESDNILN